MHAWSIDEMIEKRAPLLHIETGTVCIPKKIWEKGQWISPINKKPVDAVVLECDFGHAFVVRDADSFVPLTPDEVEVWRFLVTTTTDSLKIAARTANARKMDIEIFGVLASAVMRHHEQQMGAVVAQEKAKRQKS